MAKLSTLYRTRARRVYPVSQQALGVEAQIALYGIKEGVEAELYDRTPLKVTGAMRRSVKLQFLGRAYKVGFDTSIAKHAPIRVNDTGISKLGGHLKNMNPTAYLFRNFGVQMARVRAQGLKKISGDGGESINGR